MPVDMKALLNQTMDALEKESETEVAAHTRLDQVHALVNEMDFGGSSSTPVYIFRLDRETWALFRDVLSGETSFELAEEGLSSALPDWRLLASLLGIGEDGVHLSNMTIDLSDTICVFRPQDEISLFIGCAAHNEIMLRELCGDLGQVRAFPDLKKLREALSLFER